MTTYRLPLGSPLQLLLLACSFALAGYAGVRLLADDWFGVALWFVGAAVVHDLVLLPLYAAADRALVRAADRALVRSADTAGPPVRGARVMYVRVPAALSGLRDHRGWAASLLSRLLAIGGMAVGALLRAVRPSFCVRPGRRT